MLLILAYAQGANVSSITPGVSILVSNILIFLSSVIWKVGRINNSGGF